jgi:hypothetical protein
MLMLGYVRTQQDIRTDRLGVHSLKLTVNVPEGLRRRQTALSSDKAISVGDSTSVNAGS